MEININCSDKSIYYSKNRPLQVFDLYDESEGNQDRVVTVDTNIQDWIHKPAPVCKYQQCRLYTVDDSSLPFVDTFIDLDLNNTEENNERAVYQIDTTFPRRSVKYFVGCQLFNSSLIFNSSYEEYNISLDCSKMKYYETVP